MFHPSDKAIRYLCNSLYALREPSTLLKNYGLLDPDEYVEYDNEVRFLRKPSSQELKQDLERARNVGAEQLRNLCCELLRNQANEDWYYGKLDYCPLSQFRDPLAQFEAQLLDDGYKLSSDGLSLLELNPAVSVAQLADEALSNVLQSSDFAQRHGVLGFIESAKSHLIHERYNESLSELRSALQSCLKAILCDLAARRGEYLPNFKEDWEVRDCLKKRGFLAREENKGFDGIYGLLSAGSHAKGTKDLALLGYAACLMACHYAITKLSNHQQTDRQ